jgi:hypothetical protein
VKNMVRGACSGVELQREEKTRFDSAVVEACCLCTLVVQLNAIYKRYANHNVRNTHSACSSGFGDKQSKREMTTPRAEAGYQALPLTHIQRFDGLSLEPHKKNLGECVSGVVTSVMHTVVIHLGHRSHKCAGSSLRPCAVPECSKTRLQMPREQEVFAAFLLL